MKVAIISTFPPYECGIAEYCHFLINKMQERTDSLYIFAPHNCLPQASKRRIKVIPCFRPGAPDYSQMIETIAFNAPYDVIHIQHEYAIFGKEKAILDFLHRAQKLSQLLCITLHTPIHSLHPDQSLRTLQKEMIELADGIFVHSSLAEYELWQQGSDLRKIFMVPHGTYINRFRKNRDVFKFIIGAKIDLNKVFVVVIPGFLRWDKGITDLLNIAQAISYEFPDTIIIVAGKFQASDSELKLLQQSVAEVSKNSEKVYFARNFLDRKELLRYLAAADAILLPYKEWPGHVGVSGVLHLAMGSLKPILASRVPRLVEYTEFFPELSFAPGDLDGLMSAFCLLRENYTSISRKIKRLLVPFVLKTSWTVTAEKHIDIYRQLMKRKYLPLQPHRTAQSQRPAHCKRVV
ncbi:glycosyltransferase [Thermodesulforhabdus norvegica]|uniref:Glycosyltransferase involved in cell wall bisynthesis n=1 Tax=Thermodesulforhabdus norvegica TaxID=39841 RepID=A0A1I4TZ83_9BACT|nr:glycosyltransferase [Thermodesulforhabdus norvegica]SFM81921.1 Glycosyltransferase involved in cell wall bisynthesis [Thermodesulforhabdus norvegica]